MGVALACLGVAAASAVDVMVRRAAGHGPSLFEIVAITLTSAYAGVGAVVALRRPSSRVGWILLAIGAVTAFTQAADELAAVHAPGWQVESWLQQWAFYLVYPVAFSLVLLLFPTGHPPARHWRWAPLALVATQVPRIFLAAFASGPLVGHMSGTQIAEANPLAVLPTDFMNTDSGQVAAAVSWALPALALVGATASILSRWRSSDDETRQQLKWLGLVAVLAVFAFALHFATDAFFGGSLPDVGGVVLAFLLSLGIPLAIGAAMIRYRLYGVDLLLNRTIVYGLLTFALLTVYAVVLIGLDGFLQQRLSFLASLVATAVVAVVFAPLRTSLQGAVDRLLFGVRPDPYLTLAEVTLEIAHGEGKRPLLDEAATVIARTLQLSYCAIVAHKPGGSPASSGSFGERPLKVVDVALHYRGQAVGVMQLGPGPDQPATHWRRRLIADLAGQAAVAAQSVLQSTELEESQSRLLTTRENERRRLRRDLHDGLGPRLAAQTLKAGAARMAIESNPERALELLGEMERDGQVTMAEVRRLVHALRPPELDELGLAGALRQVATSLATEPLDLVLDLPTEVPPMAPEVEAATLRIAQEALTNVRRHANAAACRLSLSVDSELRLRIEDDGVGPGASRTGVGIASIIERAAELGGVATIAAGSTSGTVVDVHIPLRGTATL